MPAIVENFHELPARAVRKPHDDEAFVMNNFERHASHCMQCAKPLLSHREGRTLCRRGLQYSVDVADYIYSKNGKAHSLVDLEMNKPSLLRIPRHNHALRDLLLAIEEGMCLPARQCQTRSAPIVSYDRKYPVPPRRPATQQPVTYHQVIEREPEALQRRRVTVYPTTRDCLARGSLYDSDAADRIGHNSVSWIHRPSKYHR